MIKPARAAALLAVLAVLALTGACSQGPQPDLKDPSRGQFYTVEEMLALPQSQVDEYCRYMEETLVGLKTEAGQLRRTLDSLSQESDRLRNESVSTSSLVRQISLEIREQRLKQKVIQSYVVKEGDTLRKVAATVFGDPTRWREIYEANQGMLGSEDAPLRPGSRLRIPKQD